MNFWLEFQSTTISRAFRDRDTASTPSKSTTVLYATFVAQFSYFIIQILQLSLTQAEDSYSYHLYTSIMVSLFALFGAGVIFLHRLFPFLDRYSAYTAGFPTLSNIIGVYELFLAFGQTNMSQNTIDSALIYFQLFLIVALISLPRTWYYKALLAFVCSAYILIRKAYDYTMLIALSNAALCFMFTLALSLGFYKFERGDKERFLSHYKTSTHEKIFKSLLDGLPEGILVMDKDKNPFYSNQAMHTVLDTEENQEAVFAKIQDLHINHIVEEIQKVGDMTLFDNSSGHFFNGSSRKKHYSESPDKTQEADSPGLEPIYRKRQRNTLVDNTRLSRLLNGKNSFQQDVNDYMMRTKMNYSTTLGSPAKKNSDLGKSRQREESVHSADLLGIPKGRLAYKKGSSGYFPLEGHFRIDFDDERFKGYASNPVTAQDFIIFNLYGKYQRKDKEYLENDWQECAYEVKVREMSLEDQMFKVYVISDISIREKLANLEENSRFKNLMFASLSHEFRTPLNGIYSMLEVATKQVKDTTIVKNYLTPAFVNAHLLLYLVNDMLDYSMVLAGKLLLSLKKFSLHDCLKEVMDLIIPQAELKNLDLTLNISPNIPRKISSDKVRIQQVLVNLLNNAAKFTSKGGIVINIDQDPQRIHVLRVSVEDTGIGINETDIAKLYKLISQLDVTEKISPNSTGIGMGLMMSQALALALGPPGEDSVGIQIDSEYGKGSIFKFTVYNHDSTGTLEDINSFPSLPDERSPRSNNRTDFLTTIFNPKQGIKHVHNIGKKKSVKNVSLQKVTQQAHVQSQCQCPKVLVVDDTAYNILALQAQLQALEVTSDVAYDGQEAINKIVEANKNRQSCCQGYRLVLMDCNMPVLDGYEATRKIRIKLERKELAQLTVIGCTAYTDKALLDQGLQCGMEECITKPIKTKDLKRLLQDYGVIEKKTVEIK